MSGEELRDRNGNLLGRVVMEGRKQVLCDKNGNRLGEYHADDNVTRDRYGNRIGTGNLLMTLLRP